MSLTINQGVFHCSLELAQKIAEYADLGLVIAPYGVPARCSHSNSYYLWEDKQTGGGGCRICWQGNVAWVSRHSGYESADITKEVKEFFRMEGAEEAAYVVHEQGGDQGYFDAWLVQPHIYGEHAAQHERQRQVGQCKAAAHFFREGD